MTVRRDLDALEREGLIERVHGGAVLAQRGTEEPGFEKKALREQPEKSAIAEHAARLVKPGSAIALSAGTTTWALARQLSRVDQITVVTNSMNVWHELQQDGRVGTTVILTGGEFRTPSDALVGPTADAAIRSLYFDMLFLGVHGMDPVAGLTTPNISEAETNRAFISRCRKLVVVADHTKWPARKPGQGARHSRYEQLLKAGTARPDEPRRCLRRGGARRQPTGLRATNGGYWSGLYGSREAPCGEEV
jgi:DeoR/GlpR family transcriptional regulator of sugar metabolism